jgi:hypothetical protein
MDRIARVINQRTEMTSAMGRRRNWRKNLAAARWRVCVEGVRISVSYARLERISYKSTR